MGLRRREREEERERERKGREREERRRRKGRREREREREGEFGEVWRECCGEVVGDRYRLIVRFAFLCVFGVVQRKVV